ncbi:MAG: amino acid adenylation domain-containing protein [Actinomycetota bacterium]
MTVDTDARTEPAGEVHPLGHRQRMIWAGQLLDRDVPLYNMAHAFTLRADEPIDVDAFRRAFAALVAGHDAMRTVIDERAGEPVQRILPGPEAVLDVVDLRDEPDQAAAAEAWADERSRRRFDLGDRLYDSALLLVDRDDRTDRGDGDGDGEGGHGDARAVWYLNQHHLICDAWSVALLLGRLDELYRAAIGATDGAELDDPPSYVDFLDAEAKRVGSKGWTRAKAHWRARLDEPVEPLTFYGPRPDDAGWETVRVEARIEGDRAAQLASFLERPELASLSPELTAMRFFHTVLAAYLHRICGVDRVVIGTPFHNRLKRKQRQTAGLFMNLYPAVVEVDDGETMTSLAAKVGAELFESMQHASHPLDAGDEAGAFEVVLNYLHAPDQTFAGRPVEDRWVHPGAGDRSHSLRLQVRRLDDGFRLFFDVKTSLFDEWGRRALVDQVLRLIDGWLATADGLGEASDEEPLPELAVGGVSLLSGRERDDLLVDFNRLTGPPVPATTVVDEFRRIAADRPDAVAIEDGDERVTYGELDRRSAVVAAALAGAGVGHGSTVGVLLPRSIDAIVAILAALRTGAAYLPVEPSTPLARIAGMVADTGTAVVCTDDGHRAAVATLGLTPVVVADVEVSSTASPVDPDGPVGPDGAAYVIFTSGSTGRPKGVPIDHRGLANYVAWAARTYAEDEPRSFALHTSLAFDLTITSIFVPLTTGGSIVVYGETGGDGDDGTPAVVDVFADDRVDVVKATPSHLAIVRHLGLRAERLRTLIVGGEDFTSDLAAAIQELHPDAAIYNEYGPTETVVGCMVHRFDRTTDTDPSVPIGRPGANAEILLLDRRGAPVPPGVVGEIHIGGPGVAAGYLGRPDITAERFITRPDGLPASEAATPRLYRPGDLGRWRPGDGRPRLEFLGRTDDQVKIRGHRIELGEIEAALAEHPTVEAAAVLAVDGLVRGEGSASVAGLVAVPTDSAVVHCARCGLPSNYPGAAFVDGVCSLCRDYDTYRDQVDAYFRTPDDLRAVADRLRGVRADDRYDCLVLLSGGKDSTYMLYQVVALGLRPLVFTLDNGYISESALANCRRVCEHLGVDLEIAETEHMREIFRDSLDRFANVCNGCFKTIYTLSMNLARSNGIDHIVTGLARGQLFETRLSDMYDRRIFDVDQIDRFVLEARKAYHQIDDAVSELLDVSAFVDGRIYDEITFVDFYRYVDVGLDEVLAFLADETPWERPADTGRSTNCLINDVGIHVHNRERGFHNYALPYSWDVRLGHKQREAALHELDDEIDLDFVNEVMVEIGYRPKPPATARRSTRLVGHYQAPEPIAADELRVALADTLPDYMVPTSFVHHVTLPLTVNGKVDRAVLGRAEPGGADAGGAGGDVGSVPDLAALSDVERDRVETIRSVWAWTFDRPVGATDNFFDLGGDSISAIQIVDRAARSGLGVTPRQIFDAQTPLATALVATTIEERAVADEGPKPVAPTDRREPAGPLPLTPTQAGMLFHSLAEPASGLYQGQIVHELSGRVDVPALVACWDELVERHPTLRTAFRWEGVDEPVQHPGSERPGLVDHDWTAAGDGAARLERFLVADRADHFDLAAAPPVRVAVVATAERTVLVWSFHHIAFDGWSIALALNELLGAYQARLDGEPWSPPSTEPFSHYLDWFGTRDRAAAERFWRGELAGFTTPTALPRSRPEPSTTRSDPRPYGAAERELTPDLTETIGAFASGSRVTLSTVLQGAWALVLSRHQAAGGPDPDAADDVVFGVTTSGRPADLAGAESMVGMLVTTVPARVGVDGGLAPDAWLRAIQDRQLAVREHEYASLVDIQTWSDLPTGQSLFDSILVVENFPDYRAPDRPDALAVTSRAYRVQSNYPLSLIVLPGPALTLKAVYDPDRFDADAIDRLLAHVEGALRSLAAGLAPTVDDVTIVGEGELADLTARSEGPSIAGEDELVPSRIDRWITERPDAVAVATADQRLTYGELGTAAARLAATLRDGGVRPGDVVGLGAERSVELVTAIVGIHRAGAAYLPLDPGYPAERLAFMIDDAGVTAVVETDEGLAALAEASEFGPRRPVEGTGLSLRTRASAPTDGATDPTAATPSDRPIGADDPAYLIYTSGSTGRPNGVIVDHGNLAWSTAARIDAYEDAPDAFLLLSSFSFDSSIVGLFWTLATGGTLVLPGPGEELDVRAIGRLIEQHAVTHTLALPSLYRLLLEHASRRSLVTLSTVIVAGEACQPALVDEHAAALPGTSLHNEYGPTEASVWCTTHRIDPGGDDAITDGGSVPIGQPAPGATVAVLDRSGRPAGIGVPGEIHVAGPGLTGGYHRRAELTAERFVEHGGRRWFRTGDVGTVDDDGVIRFGGRVDDQVKIRGHRVELGEVEAALVAHPSVGDAVAVVTGSADPAAGGGAGRSAVGTGLAAHVEVGAAVGPADRPTAAELQAWVAARLPDAFVPSAIAVTESLPRLPNGKVARGDLPAIDAAPAGPPAAVAGRPSTAGQRLVGDIWTELLPGVSFGVDDDFFEIGGHSLLAVALVERLRRATGVDLPLSALLETPTVAALAARVAPAVDGNEANGASSDDATGDDGSLGGPRPGRSLVALRSTGDRVPLYLIPPAAGTALSFRAFTGSTDPAQPLYCFEPVGTYGEAEPHDTVEVMAEHYLHELRAAQPDGRYRIGGSCLGAIVAWEMAARLADAGTPVELLVFLDPGPPHSGPGWSYQLPSQRSPRQLLETTWDIVSSGQLLTAAVAVWRRNSFDRIGRIHYRAQLQYVADRLRAPILWLESEELATERPDFLDQWRILAGNDLTPIVVPGTTHDGLMTGQPEEVRLLATRFDEAMAEFERTGRLPGP